MERAGRREKTEPNGKREKGRKTEESKEEEGRLQMITSTEKDHRHNDEITRDREKEITARGGKEKKVGEQQKRTFGKSGGITHKRKIKRTSGERRKPWQI